MPLNFAIYQNILNELNYTDLKVLVTIFNLKGQLVGKNNHIRSSETLRENLKIRYHLHHPKHKKPSSDNNFGYYLAGFIEGQLGISDPCSTFDEDQLIIRVRRTDITLAYFLKSFIKFGHIHKVKNKAVITYTISNRQGILKVLNLINGKMRTFLKWNEIKNNITYVADWLPLDQSSLKLNWWLAGFIDADGSFDIQIKKDEIRFGLQINAKKDQILKIIHKEFGGNLGYISQNDTYNYHSDSSTAKLINYLKEYHLLSYKHINYLKWYKVYSMILNKKHLTEEGINKIIKIKNSM